MTMMRLFWVSGLVAAVSLTAWADEAKKVASKSDDVGFVQLFNGKDLTGWKPHPADTGCKWEVVDGAITASGKSAGHLWTERGDYTDFVVRAECKVNDKGNSGLYFRATFQKSFPRIYEAQINVGHADRIKSGSLYPGGGTPLARLPKEQRDKIIVLKAPHKADEWFVYEITAIGNHIVIKIDGQTTVDFVDEAKCSMKGHFALQYHDPTCKVFFRKVEVKELPPESK
jgi:Domain of Unknown Function (DUF1080)